MTEQKIIKCIVNGVVSNGIYKGRQITGMCGKIKVKDSECSLPLGQCEYQKHTNKE